MKEVKEKESVDMFVQLAVFQEGAFLITIRLWEGPPARPGEFFFILFFFPSVVCCLDAGLFSRRGWTDWEPDSTVLARSEISG